MSASEVTLTIGDVATCTIVNNDQQGTLHVIKHVINDNGGTLIAGDFSFTIDDGTPIAFVQDGEDASLGTADVQLDAGTYDIAEVLVAGYGASYDGCDAVSIANGGEATCIITNDDGKATLTIVKNTTYADGTFDFTVTQGENEILIQITTGEHTGSDDIGLDAGTYSVTETNVPGWNLQSVSCLDGESQVGSEIENGASITLAVGQHVVCTFSNRAFGADVSLEKVVDDSTPDQNQEVTFTLTAHNAGPLGIFSTITDLLPVGLSFVSADGDYATTTGQWYLGFLESGSTTIRHLVATVTAGAGTTVTNEAAVSSEDEIASDYNEDNDMASASVTVNTPAPTPTPTPTPSGGGGGNGPIVGSLGGGGQVLGISTSTEDFGASCERYLTDFLKVGKQNNPEQVRRLQYVLHDLEGLTVGVDGVYDTTTRDAVNAFQTKYSSLVLTPWGLSGPTGYTYLTTRKMVNEVYCHFTKNFPLTTAEQAEIDAYRARRGGTQAGATQTGSAQTTSVGTVSDTMKKPEETTTQESQQTETVPEAGTEAQAGAAATTGNGGIWGAITNFFGSIFGR